MPLKQRNLTILWYDILNTVQQGIQQNPGNFFILFIRIIFFCFLVWFYGISTFVGYLTPNPF